MAENLESILKNGYLTWRNNLNISVPFLLEWFVGVLLSIGILVIVVLFVISTMSVPLSGISSYPSYPSFPSNMLLFIAPILFFTLLIMIISLLVSAFFQAGAIGMSKTATETGKTTLDDMIKFGKKKFITMFVAYILLFIIFLLSIVFLIPGILAILLNVQNATIIIISWILGILCILAYFIILSVILAIVPYAIVVSDLGAIEGIKTGYNFFMNNKLYVFLLWLIVLAIEITIILVNTSINFILEFIPILGPILSLGFGLIIGLLTVLIISPLTAVWWTRLYLDRTTGIKTEPYPQEIPSQSREPPSSQPEIYI